MYRIHFLIGFVLLQFLSFAQQTVEIGNADGALENAVMNGYYNYSKTQHIYLASEIGTAGNINTIKFPVESYANSNDGDVNNVTVKLSHTSLESFENSDYLDLGETIHWSGSWTRNTDQDAYFVIPLSNIFSYNGIDNLIIEVRSEDGSYSGNTRPLVSYTNTTNYQAIYGRNDYTNPPDGSRTLKRGDIRLEMSSTYTPMQINAVVEDEKSGYANSGSIDIQITGGTGPFQFDWAHNYNERGAKVEHLSQGDYEVTITDFNNNTIARTYSIAKEIIAKEEIGLHLSGRDIVKDATNGDDNSNFFSRNKLKGNGTVKFKLDGIATRFVFGISRQSHGLNDYDVDYGFENYSNSSIFWVLNDGSWGSSMSIDGNDEFMIEKDGATIKLYHNGTQLPDQYTVNASDEFFVEASIIDQNGRIKDVEVDFDVDFEAEATIAPTTLSNREGEIEMEVFGGVQPYSYQWSNGMSVPSIDYLEEGQYTVTVTDAMGNQFNETFEVNASIEWANTSGLLVNGMDLVKTASTGDDDGYAYSENAIGSAGSLRFTVEDRYGRFITGLSTSSHGAGAYLVDYGFEHYSTNSSIIWVTVDNVWLGYTTVDEGDIFEIKREGNIVKFLKNEVELPYTGIVGGGHLYAEANIYDYNGKLNSFEAVNADPNLGAPVSLDSDRNWIYTKVNGSNGRGQESITYMDELERTVQVQTKLNVENKIVVGGSIFDSKGRAAVQTLPLPIDQDHFEFKENILLNTSGAVYSSVDFEGVNTFQPTPVGNSITGTVGHYYSMNSNAEFIGTTQYPYSRTYFTNSPSGHALTSTQVGDQYRLGAGREVMQFQMPARDELMSVFGTYSSIVLPSSTDPLIVDHITTGSVDAVKSVSKDAQGAVSVVYSENGRVIAKARSGISTSCNQIVEQDLSSFNTLDIHSVASENVFTLQPKGDPSNYEYSNLENGVTIQIFDLWIQKELQLGTDYMIQFNAHDPTSRLWGFEVTFLGDYANKNNFVRIKSTFNSLFIPPLSGDYSMQVVYNIDYSDWSLSFYDYKGNLRKEVSVEGVDCSNAGVYSQYTTYDYNDMNQQIAVKSAEEGTSEFVYDKDNKARFSQNVVQRDNDQFTYVIYDELDRVTEQGIYTTVSGGIYFVNHDNMMIDLGVQANPASTTVLDVINENAVLDVVGRSERIQVFYDQLDVDSDYNTDFEHADLYRWTNQMGRVAKTINDNQTSWFAYDELGRLKFVVQHISGFSTIASNCYKTIDFEYDLDGAKSRVTFQKHESNERYIQTYNVNKNGQLVSVSVGSTEQGLLTQALNTYDDLGRLSRTVIDDNLQGIDYVYTLNNQLKSINHSFLNSKDPGSDGYTNTNMAKDLFGITLDYNDQEDIIKDFQDASVHAYGPDSRYDGFIVGYRYRTKGKNKIYKEGESDYELYDEIPTSELEAKSLMNWFKYDNKNQLKESKTLIYSSLVSSTFIDDYQVYGLNYSDNGSLKSLKRNAYTSSVHSLLKDDLSYNYVTGKKQLSSVNDAILPTNISGFRGVSSYQYNKLGQLKSSTSTKSSDNISLINYYGNGLTKQVNYVDGSTVDYFYDASGKLLKSVHNNGSGEMIQYHVFGGTAIYTQLPTDTDPVLTENSIHSLGRIGVWKRQEDKKIYELKDHLGNVRVAFSRDPNTPSRTSQPNVIIERWADYYPFGGIMPGRSGGSEADYAYTYQGQRNAVGSDWHQFDLRMYSSDIGRFMSPDPYGQYYDKYLGMGNNPINGIDPDGGFFISQADGGKRWPGYYKIVQRAMPVSWLMDHSHSKSWAMYNSMKSKAKEMLPAYLREHRGFVDALINDLAMFPMGSPPDPVQQIPHDRSGSTQDMERLNDAAIDNMLASERLSRASKKLKAANARLNDVRANENSTQADIDAAVAAASAAHDAHQLANQRNTAQMSLFEILAGGYVGTDLGNAAGSMLMSMNDLQAALDRQSTDAYNYKGGSTVKRINIWRDSNGKLHGRTETWSALDTRFGVDGPTNIVNESMTLVAYSDGGRWYDHAWHGTVEYEKYSGGGSASNSNLANGVGAFGVAISAKNALLESKEVGNTLKGSKYLAFSKVLGTTASAVGVLITIDDIATNGFNTSNSLDLVFGAAGFVPGGGWAVSGGYFLLNTGLKMRTGRDIGQTIDSYFEP